MANNLDIKDGQGLARKLKTFDVGSDVHVTQSIPTDTGGNAYSGANPLPTQLVGPTASSPIPIAFLGSSGGFMQVSTDAVVGTNWVTFPSQTCRQLTIVNDTGFDLRVRQGGGGSAVTVLNSSSFTLFSITNANQVNVRRKDTTNAALVVEARWES